MFLFSIFLANSKAVMTLIESNFSFIGIFIPGFALFKPTSISVQPFKRSGT